MAKFIVQRVEWQTHKDELTAIRTDVFIKEQKVPIEEEWDDQDATAIHFIARINRQAVGVARFLAPGKLTRMAVLKDFRRKGIGSALIQATLKYAKRHNVQSVSLDAQLAAVPLYEHFEFIPYGKPFLDAGIMHIKMQRQLAE